jgi:hypothetical protein
MLASYEKNWESRISMILQLRNTVIVSLVSLLLIGVSLKGGILVYQWLKPCVQYIQSYLIVQWPNSIVEILAIIFTFQLILTTFCHIIKDHFTDRTYGYNRQKPYKHYAYWDSVNTYGELGLFLIISSARIMSWFTIGKYIRLTGNGFKLLAQTKFK